MAKLPETMELMLSNSSPDAKVWSVLCFILCNTLSYPIVLNATYSVLAVI